MSQKYIFMWSTGPSTITHWASPTAISTRPDIMRGEDVNFLSYYDRETLTAYIPEVDLERVRQTVSPWFAVAENFEAYHMHYLEEKASWWVWLREAESKDFSGLTAAELRPWYQRYTQNFYDAIANFWTSRPEWTYTVEKELGEILERHFPDTWTDILGELVAGTELDDIQRQQLDLLQRWENESNTDSLREHISQYPWFVFGQFDETAALEFVESRLVDFAGKTYAEEWEALALSKEAIKNRQAEIMVGMGEDSERAEFLAGFLRTQAHERMEIKAYWAGCGYLARNLLKRIAALMEVSLDDMQAFLSPEEHLQFLAGEVSGTELQARLPKRKQGYCIYREIGGAITIIDGDAASDYFQSHVERQKEGIRELRGQTASKGSYTGRVRKVTVGDLEDLQQSIIDFQKGEILVTSMTQPNMMVLAGRAAAILTDEGGITSHAAIISRELKIPCIVGCGIAMEVLSDGDLIEVDATGGKGIVKVLEKAL